MCKNLVLFCPCYKHNTNIFIVNQFKTININRELHNKATTVREAAMLWLLRRPLSNCVTLCAFQKYWKMKTS
jgi:hypothetical protein